MANRDITPLIIAHRGASAIAPENTLASFGQAVEDRSDGVEFDVRLSKDGVPVVFHDARLKRICGVDRRVDSFTAEELSEFDAGSWFESKNGLSGSFAGESIPTLEETLSALKDFGGVVYVELKAKEEAVHDLAVAVCEVLRRSPLRKKVIVKSFNLDAIPVVQERLPRIKTAALFAPKMKTLLNKEKRLINISRDLGVSRISLHFSLATRNLMRKAAEASLPVTIWTADSPRWIKRAYELGISHIIANNPAKLLAERQKFFRSLTG